MSLVSLSFEALQMAELKRDSFACAPEGHKISLIMRVNRPEPLTTEKTLKKQAFCDVWDK